MIPQVSPIQPINVIIHQPPGPSLWLTILLSALTGAASAILSGLVIEYVKPYMQKRRREKIIRPLLNNEFLYNLAELEAALRVLRHAEHGSDERKSHSVQVLDAIRRRVVQDRYGYYFENEKSIVYEIDNNRQL